MVCCERNTGPKQKVIMAIVLFFDVAATVAVNCAFVIRFVAIYCCSPVCVCVCARAVYVAFLFSFTCIVSGK